MGQPARGQAGDGRPDGDGRMQHARPRRPSIEDVDREDREQGSRHRERHRDEVDRNDTFQPVVARDEAQALGHEAPGRIRCRRRPLRPEPHDGDQDPGAQDTGERVDRRDAECRDHHAGERWSHDERETEQHEMEHDGGLHLFPRDQVRDDGGARDLLEDARPGRDARQEQE